ncbi:plasma membrane fusion protein [Carex rostrata]
MGTMRAVTVIHLGSATASLANSHPPLLESRRRICSKASSTVSVQLTTNRRAVILVFLVPSLACSGSAPAICLGIPGPKEWLREQKKKTSKYVLAPIDASHQTLQKAYQLLKTAGPAELEQIRGLLTSATRDCVPDQRNSIVAFQSRTGVEVCTFSLVLKNASSLLDDKDPVKLEAEADLNQLIRSFSDIGILMETSNFELSSDRKQIEDKLMDTISLLDKFEQGVKSCLGI